MILRNMSSMAGLNALKAVASVLVSFLVARAVAPASFGLVAFSIPLMTFITVLTDLGLTSAIVRHPDLSRAEAGAAVALMALTGLAGGAVLAGLAGPLETGLSLHGLRVVLTGYAAVTLLSIWAAAPRALLERGYDYGRIAIVEACALAIGLAVFAAALAGSAGIMALVAYQIAFQGVRAISFACLARNRFTLNLRVATILPLVRVGTWVLLTNIMSYCARNLDNLLIGAYLGAASLGIYGLAYQFMTLPLVLITWPVSGVLLSTLARLQDGSQAAKAGVICAIFTGTAAVSFPMMAFLMFGARFPIDAVYAHRWQGLADIVALLAPVGAVQSIAAYGGAVLVEKGAVRLNFMLGMLNGGTLSAVFFATVWLGLPTLIGAYMVASVAVSAVMIVYVCREAAISLRQFLACLVPGGAATFAGVVCVAVLTGLTPRSFGQWLVCSAVYGLSVLAAYGVVRQRLFTPFRVLTRSGDAIAGLATT